MARAGLVAAGVLGAAALAGAAVCYFALRDTAEPVGVGEAVTSFRTETETGPVAASPIPEGVYVYATRGVEHTDALTGVTHRYPARSTIAVRAAGCGMSLLWRVLEGRSTEWIFCVTRDGWELHAQDERHTFFGRTETTTYTCEDTPIRPAPGSPATWSVSCATGDADEQGTGRLAGTESVDVAGRPVVSEHVTKRTTFSGGIRGRARYDFWFAPRSGVPVRIVMVSRTTNDSPVGDVTYDEDVTLELTSLRPRR